MEESKKIVTIFTRRDTAEFVGRPWKSRTVCASSRVVFHGTVSRWEGHITIAPVERRACLPVGIRATTFRKGKQADEKTKIQLAGFTNSRSFVRELDKWISSSCISKDLKMC